ncbi:hypothetical protein [Actinomadura rudentiformis]|uniref:Secreted protein n=1 Tax=Actinomadura rudentiformis TaxID=359158 RepID=A0A6H9YME7_9ACTN|nr:hypothetical protein [Actinomadura rudentiformis]KAB2348580.1 hypothetical protein F8566_17565 [Actinomadura rudentiformis]
MKIRSRAVAASIALAATTVATALTAAPASADTHTHWQLNNLTFTPVLWGIGTNPGEPNCHYRLRYGNFGNVAFAQIRMYGGACGAYRVQVRAYSGSTGRNWGSGGTGITGTDGCGSYIELQATSDPNWIAVSGVAVSGRPSPNKAFYHFDHPNYLTQPAIPSSRIVRHCDGS